MEEEEINVEQMDVSDEEAGNDGPHTANPMSFAPVEVNIAVSA